MKKFLPVVIVILLCAITNLQASKVTVKQANTVANNFYFERNNNNPALIFSSNFVKEIIPVSFHSETVIYFVNYIDGGWIAISASDATIPIIAYSTKGNYSPDYNPDNFKAWISQYRAQVYEAITTKSAPSIKANQQWNKYLSEKPEDFMNFRLSRSVEPMIVTSWDQGLYYNQMCPDDNGGPGGHCLTGCVPTCMGQISNYFRWPQTGTGSYSYDGGAYGTLSANFEETTYRWNEMPASCDENSLATAQLLFHFGVSCDLVYGPSGSGMYNHSAAYALRTHFKYSPETEYLYRDSTNLNWDSVIIAHLDKKIPLYYAGWSVPNINGHAFVCDGYQDDDYFHFNWGWSGSNDGYFYTDNLNPGGNNFNLAQELIINCFPDTVNYTYPLYCSGAETLVTNLGTINDGSGPVYDYIENQDCSWLLSPTDSILSISLDFYEFDIDISDTLYVYDGNSDLSNILGAYTGANIPESITSTGDEVFVVFKTNEQNNAKGWLMGFTSNLPSFCTNLVLNDPVGTISDGSGSANYQNLTTCIWMIEPDTTGDITLTFSEFDTEENHDFVTVYDGSDKIGEFSGNEIPPVQTITNGKLTIVFSTNSSITNSGWEASYSAGSVGVELQSQPKINIFPNPVDNNVTIEIPEELTIKTIRVFNMFGIEVISADCNNSSKYSINTSEIKSGMYIIELSDGMESFTKKITVLH